MGRDAAASQRAVEHGSDGQTKEAGCFFGYMPRSCWGSQNGCSYLQNAAQPTWQDARKAITLSRLGEAGSVAPRSASLHPTTAAQGRTACGAGRRDVQTHETTARRCVQDAGARTALPLLKTFAVQLQSCVPLPSTPPRAASPMCDPIADPGTGGIQGDEACMKRIGQAYLCMWIGTLGGHRGQHSVLVRLATWVHAPDGREPRPSDRYLACALRSSSRPSSSGSNPPAHRRGRFVVGGPTAAAAARGGAGGGGSVPSPSEYSLAYSVVTRRSSSA